MKRVFIYSFNRILNSSADRSNNVSLHIEHQDTIKRQAWFMPHLQMKTLALVCNFGALFEHSTPQGGPLAVKQSPRL